MAPRFRRPSPALMLAVIALFVALGGSAIASGIVQIVPRAKFAAKAGIANNALKLGGKTAGQIVASVPKPPPPAPPLASIASFSTIKSAPFSLTPSTPPNLNVQNVTATCDAGQKAVAGGFNNPTNALVLELGSSPTADGSGWVERLGNFSSTTTGNGTVVATCIK